jgi:hypothetical protein
MQPIAERELNLKRPDGTRQPVRICISSPEDRRERGWVADIEVHGPGDEVSRSSGSGIDGLQALEGALHMIPIMLGKVSLMGELCLGDEPGTHFASIRLLPDDLDIIAQRTLAFRPHQRDVRRVLTYLGHPYQRGMRDVWFVRANVIDEEKRWDFIQAEGADPIAALLEATRRISVRLDWYLERGELIGVNDLRKIAAALADGAPDAPLPKHDPRKAALTEVADAGRRLGRALIVAARSLTCMRRTR